VAVGEPTGQTRTTVVINAKTRKQTPGLRPWLSACSGRKATWVP
jgi:hypothetical protein